MSYTELRVSLFELFGMYIIRVLYIFDLTQTNFLISSKYLIFLHSFQLILPCSEKTFIRLKELKLCSVYVVIWRSEVCSQTCNTDSQECTRCLEAEKDARKLSLYYRLVNTITHNHIVHISPYQKQCGMFVMVFLSFVSKVLSKIGTNV